ncbi:MAG: endonuclease III [Isosphaeraceae bacterium]
MPSPVEWKSDLISALAARYGRPEPPGSGQDAFEAVVATLLGLSLDPRRQARAIDALRDAGLLDPSALAEADPAEVAEAFRSEGLTVPDRVLGPLRKVSRWLVDLHHGDAEGLRGPDADSSTGSLRDELLAVNGVGPATADALLLFAFGRAVYPLDRATYRIFVRHGWLDTSTEYDEARDVVEQVAPDDPAELARLSVWLERVGRDACKTSVAKCEKCPLRPLLPAGGPVDPYG